MSVPELKQKKIARDQKIAAEQQALATKIAAEKVAFEKAITERAEKYEQEYNQVIFFPTLIRC